jgi:hypothetical protein
VAIHLRTVANAFVQAQQRRNDADYDMAKEWTPVEVDTQIASVSEAFETWSAIRNEAAAQNRGQTEAPQSGDSANHLLMREWTDRLA